MTKKILCNGHIYDVIRPALIQSNNRWKLDDIIFDGSLKEGEWTMKITGDDNLQVLKKIMQMTDRFNF